MSEVPKENDVEYVTISGAQNAWLRNTLSDYEVEEIDLHELSTYVPIASTEKNTQGQGNKESD